MRHAQNHVLAEVHTSKVLTGMRQTSAPPQDKSVKTGQKTPDTEAIRPLRPALLPYLDTHFRLLSYLTDFST